MNLTLPLVLTTGLLDSINPCAIAIILLFLGVMFTLQKKRKEIIALGSAYIVAIFLTYFAIGLGLLKVTHLFRIPHFMAYVGSYLAIGIGLINLKDYFFPGTPIHIKIPFLARLKISDYTHRATLSAAIIAGVLVGVCEFPCSGPIYLSVIGLLSFKTSFVKGIGYLFLYNIMFVLPLVVILGIASNNKVTMRMMDLREEKAGLIRLITAIIMIGIGATILIWFV